jgi:hypothetical protein
MATDTVYKLRHIETGLFYQPHQRGCNTSTVGKVYNSKPARVGFLSISKENADRLGLETVFRDYSRDCELDEWEVVAYTLEEIKKENK